jgi:NADH-quinone oxidoreductase subunit C
MKIIFAKNTLKRYIRNITFKQGLLYITVCSPKALLFVAAFLKKSCFFQMNQLLDYWAVDLKQGDQRFQLNVLLNSTFFNERIILRLLLKYNEPAQTLSTLYPSSNWLEREIYDMFGIIFNNHSDLRRILTDYGFEGYPLRKDFPLTGYLEVRFDDEVNRVVYEPLELTQEYRNFVFVSPWEKVA